MQATHDSSAKSFRADGIDGVVSAESAPGEAAPVDQAVTVFGGALVRRWNEFCAPRQVVRATFDNRL